MILVALLPIDCVVRLFAVRRHGSDGVLGTAGALLFRGCEARSGMIENPEPIVVGQVNQAAAGILKNAGYAAKGLENLGVRGIAEVKNPDGFRGALGIPDDSRGIFVGNFGEADGGT